MTQHARPARQQKSIGFLCDSAHTAADPFSCDGSLLGTARNMITSAKSRNILRDFDMASPLLWVEDLTSSLNAAGAISPGPALCETRPTSLGIPGLVSSGLSKSFDDRLAEPSVIHIPLSWRGPERVELASRLKPNATWTNLSSSWAIGRVCVQRYSLASSLTQGGRR